MPILLGNYRAYRGQKAVKEKVLDPIEIYPQIFVYKNLFKDISKTFSILKDEDKDAIFSPWSEWSSFGEYLNPLFKGYPGTMSLDEIKAVVTKTEKDEEQKAAIIELFDNFYLATEDYIIKNNVDFDKDKMVTAHDGESIKLWKTNGPSIARYRTDIQDPVAMTYHSDYIREPMTTPGYKFAITALAYFNDDYAGGEIDFIVDGEAYMYKPEAGDYLLFPSGHPDILTKDGHVYIHGVMPATGEKKYLSRMYWMKYEVGDPMWFKRESQYGKEEWAKEWVEIMEEFKQKYPNKQSADKERRVK
jgi:hypothetical protein